MPKQVLQVTAQEYQDAGSKFIAMTPDEKTNGAYRNVEIVGYDWDKPGSSIKVEVQVTEESQDNGKKDKLSFGVEASSSGRKSGIFKGRAIYLAVLGREMVMEKGHPVVNMPEDLLGKKAVAFWKMRSGPKGGDPNAEMVEYPKIIEILAAGTKPTTKVEGL